VLQLIGYIPIATTLVALTFSWSLFRRFQERGGLHLLWWGVGTLTYAAGTITEALTTLLGWDPTIFRLWYITGALLGGAPLAQGSVYLLLPRRTAHALTAILVTAIGTASLCVLASPLRLDLVEPHRLSGNVLAWPWVRMFSPFINTYAFFFLVGGALVSALRYAEQVETRHRFVGNLLIAVGALLPGVGGTFTRFGHTEVLYVTEFIGLLLIFAGYRMITRGNVIARSPMEPTGTTRLPASPLPGA